ncbi:MULTISPECIES: 5-dehydro-4-deoxy-D-glucuronate isomerase [Thermoanaerobacter]|uniref:4-deoxy-L-threo-5-hexosulose-uronate ketol-isomerase n=1 Tax=Thermoanaerobacter italicus (strain DSM 9252 / Ab9) TaxID=580331 RepID=D3T427_THEIA|nr:5-dehydro-4-deoxy-D-glucuronate isomerase [Thermoanaerobacter italicus]ADD02979.1 4-deoxy-L-threo-5-hexosulose-uronate ketol-isomerase [Thermoanaerobacter italicus Ab9]
MEVRYANHPDDYKLYSTDTLRKHFLIEKIFVKDVANLIYSHIDRIIFGGIMPVDKEIELNNAARELRVKYFLERREMGIINIGNDGVVKVDGIEYRLKNKDGLYVGRGAKDIQFKSIDKENPAKFYVSSTPAHASYPTVKIEISKANPVKLGNLETSNERTIYQYVHPAVCKSCQLLMGMTILEPGSVWNTMPCHTHDRRMEVYFYFDMDDDTRVFHFMGEPQETRHIVVANEQAVISPSWSIHSGVGTKNYTFIWSMAGENQDFDDMDFVDTRTLK